MPVRIHLICSSKLIPAIDNIAASLFPLSDDWLSAISHLQREPRGNGSATFFCLKPLKTFFWNLKDEVPLNFQTNIQRPNTTLISIDWYYFWPTHRNISSSVLYLEWPIICNHLQPLLILAGQNIPFLKLLFQMTPAVVKHNSLFLWHIYLRLSEDGLYSILRMSFID